MKLYNNQKRTREINNDIDTEVLFVQHRFLKVASRYNERYPTSLMNKKKHITATVMYHPIDHVKMFIINKSSSWMLDVETV